MGEKIARTGIVRKKGATYFIQDGNVWVTWSVPRGQAKPEPKLVAETGLEMDYAAYVYFQDKDGDLARKPRDAAESPAEPATPARRRRTPASTHARVSNARVSCARASHARAAIIRASAHA